MMKIERSDELYERIGPSTTYDAYINVYEDLYKRTLTNYILYVRHHISKFHSLTFVANICLVMIVDLLVSYYPEHISRAQVALYLIAYWDLLDTSSLRYLDRNRLRLRFCIFILTRYALRDCTGLQKAWLIMSTFLTTNYPVIHDATAKSTIQSTARIIVAQFDDYSLVQFAMILVLYMQMIVGLMSRLLRNQYVYNQSCLLRLISLFCVTIIGLGIIEFVYIDTAESKNDDYVTSSMARLFALITESFVLGLFWLRWLIYRTNTHVHIEELQLYGQHYAHFAITLHFRWFRHRIRPHKHALRLSFSDSVIANRNNVSSMSWLTGKLNANWCQAFRLHDTRDFLVYPNKISVDERHRKTHMQFFIVGGPNSEALNGYMLEQFAIADAYNLDDYRVNLGLVDIVHCGYEIDNCRVIDKTEASIWLINAGDLVRFEQYYLFISRHRYKKRHVYVYYETDDAESKNNNGSCATAGDPLIIYDDVGTMSRNEQRYVNTNITSLGVNSTSNRDYSLHDKFDGIYSAFTRLKFCHIQLRIAKTHSPYSLAGDVQEIMQCHKNATLFLGLGKQLYIEFCQRNVVVVCASAD